ncbi:hypothetical protein RZE82_07835 [Mollicutes bacterium LVI A0039]|nr:hypothetical protein RZE82_07835 [Mollicutes bacterium LVI A0039]
MSKSKLSRTKILRLKKIVSIIILLSLIFITKQVITLVSNYFDYKEFCTDNDLVCEQIIITTSELSEFKTDNTDSTSTFDELSPLSDDIDELRILRDETIHNIDTELLEVDKLKLSKEELITLEEIKKEFEIEKNLDYSGIKKIQDQIRNLEEVQSNISNLRKVIETRVNNQEIDKKYGEIKAKLTEIEVNDYYNKLSTETKENIKEYKNVLETKMYTEEYKKSLDSLSKDLDQIKRELESSQAVEQNIYQPEQQGNSSVQAKPNTNQNNNLNSGNNSSEPKVPTPPVVNETVKPATCYSSYEEAKSIATSTMLADESIGKFKIDSATNCIEYHYV